MPGKCTVCTCWSVPQAMDMTRLGQRQISQQFLTSACAKTSDEPDTDRARRSSSVCSRRRIWRPIKIDLNPKWELPHRLRLPQAPTTNLLVRLPLLCLTAPDPSDMKHQSGSRRLFRTTFVYKSEPCRGLNSGCGILTPLTYGSTLKN